jgi:hypothetical protein
MWLVEKLETVQAHFILDVEGLRDQRKLNEWQFYMASYDDTKWFMFHSLLNIVSVPLKKQVGVTQKLRTMASNQIAIDI